jgi:hypothetical protein
MAGSGTCQVDDQVVIKRSTRELGVAPNFCLDFIEVIKLSLIELS